MSRLTYKTWRHHRVDQPTIFNRGIAIRIGCNSESELVSNIDELIFVAKDPSNPDEFGGARSA